MAFPICDSCASSGVLCSSCEKKVREGKISDLDVLLSTILANYGASGYKWSREIDGKLLIVGSPREAKEIIGYRGGLAAELSRKLGRRIIVVSDEWSKEEIARSIGRPARLVKINKIYRASGDVLKLVFDKPIGEESAQIIKEMLGNVEIDHEE